MERQLYESAKNSLRYELYSNAAFLCERLLACFSGLPSNDPYQEEVRLMLAESYIGESKNWKAYEVLRDCQSDRNRYKFSFTCIKLKKWTEAERVLLCCRGKSDINNVPNGSAGLYLLAHAQEQQGKQKEAIKNYKIALEQDPTLWCAYERLCKIVPNEVEPSKYFKENHSAINSLNQYITNIDSSPQIQIKRENMMLPPQLVKGTQDSKENLRIDVIMQSDNNTLQDEINQPVGEQKTPQQQNQFTTPGSNQIQAKLQLANQPSFGPGSGLRPNDQLSNSIGSSLGEGMVRPFSLSTTPPIPYLINQQHDGDTLMNLLRLIGDAYLLLQKYQCTEAEEKFQKLTSKQRETGLIQSLIARCLFEQVKYAEAAKCYDRSMKLESYRIEGLEYYSTCLWHLKRQEPLVYLSNYCLERAPDISETMCVVGNCYSLQKEHETALKYFSQAVKLDKNMAYAHTLSGHEYVANEDYEKAKRCFQYALNVDNRHYNAWWGLGNIAYRQENYSEADQNFANATEINSKLATLWTYRGMALHNCQKTSRALQCFDRAEKIDPRSPLNKYQKAIVLLTLERYQDALEVLEKLTHLVPKEAPVFIMIGKCQKKLNHQDLALQAFNTALELDPKDTNMVKTLIDKLDQSMEMSEEGDLLI